MKKLKGLIFGEKEIEIPEGVFLVDGYTVGGSLLDTINFEVCVKNEKIEYIKLHKDSHKDYFEQFNQNLFFDKVKNKIERMIKSENGGDVMLTIDIIKKYNLISPDGYYG